MPRLQAKLRRKRQKAILDKNYPDSEITLTQSIDESLIGGYVVKVGYKEFDHSYEGRLRQLERKLTGRMTPLGAISATDIISIIQGEIENINWDEESRETGEVIWVGDGIVTVYGIDHAMYGEIVAFENGVKGMVQDVRQNEIGIILFGRDTGIKEGTKVVRTKKKAGIPVGDAFVGRSNQCTR